VLRKAYALHWGVALIPDRFRVRACVKGGEVYLGRFENMEDAVKAYQVYAKKQEWVVNA